MFIIVYEDRGYMTTLPLNGRLTVQTSPFEIESTVYFKDRHVRISPFKEITETGKATWRSHSTNGEPLSSIDGLLIDDFEHGIKIEVIKGVVYLQDRPLESYFYDPETCTSADLPYLNRP
ncbi:MAG: hypothetical protein HGA85_02795 [Nanoarchaeota archaeon]|nr:hypothetical protein [Nanoarchaeota archaeon]